MKLPYRFESRREAEFAAIWLHHEVDKTIKEYGCISVVDVYDFMNIITMDDPIYGKFTDNKYGWNEIHKLYTNTYRIPYYGYSEYGIELSEPRLIK